MSDKLMKNSFILVIGNLLFRIGGYINRLLMTRLLGPEGYGLYGLTLPFQGVFQILSAGGLPPAIAKYVAQFNAKDEKALIRQIMHIATRYMIFMALILSILLLFSSDFIANNIFHMPDVVWPLRAVSLIPPFSVIVGAMRGAYQGVYKNEYTVYNRLAEQASTIIFACLFVVCGFYAMGAVLGGAVGFIVSAIVAVYLYKKHISGIFKSDDDLNLTKKEELKLLYMLIKFSIPVTITALSEMVIYDVGTIIIGIFMLSRDVGYYNSADPIARMPLVISLSIATVMLPAASEAYALKDQNLLQKYVVDCLRYCILTFVPLCLIISIFSSNVIHLLFGSIYIPASGVLSILVVGMSFYSIYMVCSSILQGTGSPKTPMYVLLMGTIINVVLNVLFVKDIGIEGAAVATTITTAILMCIILFIVIRKTKIKLPIKNIALILLCNVILALICIVIPKTIMGLIIGSIVSLIVYMLSLLVFRVLSKDDIIFFINYVEKIPYIKRYTSNIMDFIDKHKLYSM